MAHLSRGSQLCLFNIVLTVPPLSLAFEGLERAEALVKSKANKRLGFAPTKVDQPSFRTPWVCNRIFDLNGRVVSVEDARHPCKSADPGLEQAIEDVDSEEEFIISLS